LVLASVAAASGSRRHRGLTGRRATKLEDLNVDDEFEGTVKRVANIGIYVDIGAEKDALLPSMMIPKGTRYKVGDKISGLTITEVQTGDTPATRKIRLNVKAAPVKVQEGEIIEGTCQGSAPSIGAFFDIGEPANALAPQRFLTKPLEEYQQGDKVELRVVSIEGTRITVSPDLEPKSVSKIEDLVEGQKVQGTVIRANPQFGLFMDIGTERDALYRVNQLEKPVNEYQEGEKVEGLRISSINLERQEVEVSTKQMPSECKVGEVLEGTVESITKFGVFFDAGLTVSVLCPLAFLGKPASEYTVGEVADLTIMTIEAATNRISVSTQAGAPISDFPRGAQVSGTVTSKTAAGLNIDVGAIRDALARERNLPKPLSEYNVGDEITNLFVVQSDGTRSQLEVSSTEVLESQQEGGANEILSLSELKVGDPVDGKVSRVMDFGVFVDVGAERDALYAISELDKPIDQYKRGDELTGLKIIQADPSRQRLAVSSRKLAGDFTEGEVIDGKVDNVLNFGAFIDVGASMQALLPARLMSKESDQYKTGDEIKGLVVVSVDAAENKMVLKEPGVEDSGSSGMKISDLRVGQQLKGTIKSVKEYGAFVDIGLGRKEALLPASFVKAKEGMTLEELESGQSLDVYVVRLDVPNEKVTLSLTEPSEDSVVAPGSRVSGGKLPLDTVAPDPVRAARILHMNGKGAHDIEQLDKYTIPWEQWAQDYPDLVEFSEKEEDVVLFAHSKLQFTGIEELKQSKPFYVPVPVQLRKDPTETPEIPASTFVEGFDNENDGLSYDYKTSHDVHRKYMQPPLNDPNWRFRPLPGEIGRYYKLDANKKWGGMQVREPFPDWSETY
jgi:small subunit ribosomal protein S1